MMHRARRLSVLILVVGCTVTEAGRAWADDDFLAGMSSVVTRETLKKIKGKRIPFRAGPLQGAFTAVDPDQTLQIRVKEFELANDLVRATLGGVGRVAVDANIDGEMSVSAVFDVKLAIAAEARFTQEAGTFFVEPVVKDIDLTLVVLEVSRSELKGGEELLSNLAMATFKKNKEQVIAEVNKRLGKRPF